MKLIRFEVDRGLRLGVLDGEDAVDLIDALESAGPLSAEDRAR